MQEELKAFIDEENCIGCSKCIRTCPTDAIVGSKHVLHTILPKICTSCGHCVDACPTNCITISQLGEKLDEDTELKLTQQKQLRLNSRLGKEPNLFVPSQISVPSNDAAQQRKQSVLDAIARVKAKKNLAN